jgi:hypothetical protein
MKTKNLRGMRDVPTIQGLRHRFLPGTREQTVAEVARLEHEKARLERELSLWLQHQDRTEKQLRQVEERPKGKAGSDEGEAQGWREISLEY